MDPLVYRLYDFWVNGIMLQWDDYGTWWYFTSDVMDLLIGC